MDTDVSGSTNPGPSEGDEQPPGRGTSDPGPGGEEPGDGSGTPGPPTGGSGQGSGNPGPAEV